MKFYFTVIVVTLLKLCEITSSNPLVIQTASGKIRGISLKSSTNKYVNAWYGIPYAEPPVGDLRFQRPVPACPWNNVLETTEKPNSCLQTQSFVPKLKISEDCLYLNVVAPKIFSGKLTVMVWIYGGGFYQGSSSLAMFDLKNLVAEENVIVVSFQYRLSSLGFLYLGIPEAPGNVGLYDQLLALKWVQKNIESFGGDPESVTLFGESAGAASIGFHLMSQMSKSLFNRAIMESGISTAPWALTSKNSTLEKAFILAESLNCPHDCSRLEAMVECLKNIDGKLLIEKEWKIPLSLGDIPFYPVVDGALITDLPKKLLSSGRFQNKNLLIGYNSDEIGLLFIFSLSKIFPDINDMFITKPVMTFIVNALLRNSFNQDAIDAIISVYTKSITNYRDVVLRLGSDYFFNCDTNKMAQKFSDVGGVVYKYVFTHHSFNSIIPAWTNATHTDELPYVFGQTLNSALGFTDDEKNMTRKIMKYWSNFAKTGDPNGDDDTPCLVKWPRYKPKEKKYLELNLEEFEIKKGPIISECNIWEKYL